MNVMDWREQIKRSKRPWMLTLGMEENIIEQQKNFLFMLLELMTKRIEINLHNVVENYKNNYRWLKSKRIDDLKLDFAYFHLFLASYSCNTMIFVRFRG